MNFNRKILLRMPFKHNQLFFRLSSLCGRKSITSLWSLRPDPHEISSICSEEPSRNFSKKTEMDGRRMLLKIRRFFSRTKTIAHTAAISCESTLHPPTVMLSAPGAIRGKAYCFKRDLLLIFSMKNLTI